MKSYEPHDPVRLILCKRIEHISDFPALPIYFILQDTIPLLP